MKDMYINRSEQSWLPKGASVVSPFLVVQSIERELEFLEKAFNAEVVDSMKEPEGYMSHCEVRIGGSNIMIGRGNEKFPVNTNMIYVYVPDVDEAFSRALESGAEKIMDPENRFYGNREGGVKDKDGNTWWIAQLVENVSPEEMRRRWEEIKRSNT